MKQYRQKLLHTVLGRYPQENNQQQLNQKDSLSLSKRFSPPNIDREVNKVLKQKYNTFRSWDYRQSIPKSNKKLSISIKKDQNDLANKTSKGGLNFTSILSQEKNKKQRKPKILKIVANQIEKNDIQQLPTPINSKKTSQLQKQKVLVNSQTLALKKQKRQRLKKTSKLAQILNYYMQNQQFKPSDQQKVLIQKLLNLQKYIESEFVMANNESQINLESILQKIYKIMNLCVDFNELLYLSQVIYMTAQICFFLKDYPRAFYFFNQTRIASSYARISKLKISALMGLAYVCLQLQYTEQSKRIFKKALQYAWLNKDENTQLQVYDAFGKIYNQLGKIDESYYYHEKYAKSILQPHNSSLIKISKNILKDCNAQIQSLQDTNLDTLFLQYLNLPIDKSYEIKIGRQIQPKKYGNEDEQGLSPRLRKDKKNFTYQNFPQIKFQIQNLLQNDYEFKHEIPDPDKPGTQQLKKRLTGKTHYDAPFGSKKKNEIQFERSRQFHKIMPHKPQKPNLQQELKLPLDQVIKQKMSEHLEPEWYEKIVAGIKKKRAERVGTLKEKVRNSHMSYYKYPSERKRNSFWSSQKIRESINKTFLDWIDPQK